MWYYTKLVLDRYLFFLYLPPLSISLPLSFSSFVFRNFFIFLILFNWEVWIKIEQRNVSVALISHSLLISHGILTTGEMCQNDRRWSKGNWTIWIWAFLWINNVKKYFAQTSILSIFQHYFLLSPSSHLDT